MMRNYLETDRLFIKTLDANDCQFMLDILTSPSFLKYIGNRNVNTIAEAEAYLEKVIANPAITYYIVNLKGEGQTLDMVSVIKRDYLDHHDIGFAFLPSFAKQGYAFEATQAVLKEMFTLPEHDRVLAVVKRENQNSISLLSKLGLQQIRVIEVEGESLLLYKIDRGNE